MKTITNIRSKLFFFAGLLCLCVPITMMLFWFHACDIGTNQVERVEIFNKMVPDFLHPRGATEAISILFSVLASVFYVGSLIKATGLFRVLNIITLLFSTLLLMWNLFILM